MTPINCETQGHLRGHDNKCVFCKTPLEQPTAEPKADLVKRLRTPMAYGGVPDYYDWMKEAASEVERLMLFARFILDNVTPPRQCACQDGPDSTCTYHLAHYYVYRAP